MPWVRVFEERLRLLVAARSVDRSAVKFSVSISSVTGA
jgi:hypothetical protein